MILEEKLLRLTSFWYEYVGMDHHKDRDCRFTITETWEYGELPKYKIEHYGYIADEYEEEAEDLNEASEKLYQMLKKIITEEKKSACEKLQEPDLWDEIQLKKAKKIIDFEI